MQPHKVSIYGHVIANCLICLCIRLIIYRSGGHARDMYEVYMLYFEK